MENTGASSGTSGASLLCRFQGTTFELNDLPLTTSVLEIKIMLEGRTRVLTTRQKLLELKVGGRLAPDSATLAEMKLKTPQKVTVVGTPEEQIFVDPCDMDALPEVFDDFDLDASCHSDEWARAIENSANLATFTRTTDVHFINPPRSGKRLLVLDLDHTLLDFSTRQEVRVEQLKRPHMDAFLTAVHVHYDLAVWSQTSWRWLEIKLTELGMLTHPGYKICFVLDKTSMFDVTSTLRDGTERRHYVKPLKIIWDKFNHQWHEGNTLHVDDLARNFALNTK
ncbi:unnamed protein product [Phaeothamnion confervicola]